MNLRKRFSLALAALTLLLVAGAGSAFAQTVQFNLGTAPTFVANTGLSEVMGQVTMTADATCGTGADGLCVSTAGSLQILYVGTDCDNGLATGITITSTIVGYLTGINSVNNTAGGCVVAFGVAGLIDVASGGQVTVSGARGMIAEGPGNLVGTSIIGQLTASPSTIASFQPTSEVVARSADPLEVEFDGDTLVQCDPTAVEITITITEGFNTAFVDHGFALAPANPRPLFGAVNNSEVRIQIDDLPDGVEITWPDFSSTVDLGGGLVSVLELEDQSSNGDEAIYSFQTDDQGLSDNESEEFEIVITDADIDLSETPDDIGSSTGSAQMWPDDTDDDDRPRYDHPLEGEDDFLTVAPCETNLLFTWVANFAGLDTGLAISNTSKDPYGTDTENQAGTCQVNLYPTDTTTNNGVALTGPITITTAVVQPGSVWRSTMSGIPTFAGKAGYIIAVCNFQFGHGFAFFTDRFGLGSPETAQGYVASIIPDPDLNVCDRSSSPDGDICGPATGEALGN
jgi:hypothetical protein